MDTENNPPNPQRQMTSYQNTIMDLLTGETPKAKHDYLVELILHNTQQREKLALDFVEWVFSNPEKHQDIFDVNELLDLYKQSLTKTDKK